MVIGSLVGGQLVTSAMTLGGYKAEFQQLKDQVISDRGTAQSLRDAIVDLRLEIVELKTEIRALKERR